MNMEEENNQCQLNVGIDEMNKIHFQLLKESDSVDAEVVAILSLMEMKQGYTLSEMQCNDIIHLDIVEYENEAKKHLANLLRKNKEFGEKVQQILNGKTASYEEFFSSPAELCVISFNNNIGEGPEDICLIGNQQRMLELLDFSILLLSYTNLTDGVPTIQDVEQFLIDSLGVELEGMQDIEEYSDYYELNIKGWQSYFEHIKAKETL